MSGDAERGPAPRVPTIDDFPESGTNALATITQRAWARTLDSLIVFFVAQALLDSIPVDLGDPAEDPRILLVFAGLWILVSAAYDTVLGATIGTTVGKFVLGTRIARFADGARPSWGQAALRGLVPVVPVAALASLVPPVYWLVASGGVYLSSLANPLGRGWHDLAGGSVVIRTR